MFTTSLISLPTETARRVAEGSPRQGGGGNSTERLAGMVVVIVSVAMALLSVFLRH